MCPGAARPSRPTFRESTVSWNPLAAASTSPSSPGPTQDGSRSRTAIRSKNPCLQGPVRTNRVATRLHCSEVDMQDILRRGALKVGDGLSRGLRPFLTQQLFYGAAVSCLMGLALGFWVKP